MVEPAVTHLKDLTPDPANRRSHNPRNIGMLVDALHKVGASRSIVVDENGVILAGNGVVEAASEAGLTKVQIVEADGETVIAVRRRGLSESQKRDLAIYDNRTAELATWNAEQLAADLVNGEDLKTFFFDEELREVLGSPSKVGLTDSDAVPLERATEIKEGDIFQLGPHHLACGNCLDPVVIDRLTTDSISTVVTSPPYWTQQSYDTQPLESGIRDFIQAWSAVWAPRVRRRIQIETGHTNSTLSGNGGPLRKILLDALWQSALEQQGWLLRHRRIWAKGGGNLQAAPISDLIDESWEVILTFYRPNHNEGGQERVSEAWAQMGVWKDIRGEGIDGHPCPFPIAIADRLVRLYSVTDDIVADPFCGSGSTIIACEQLQRRGLGLELKPTYCQVTIDRWEAFTGQRAVKVGEAIRP